MSDPNTPRYVRVTLEVPVYHGELAPEQWLWESLLGTSDPVFVTNVTDINETPEVD
jgi:hypothetical protein